MRPYKKRYRGPVNFGANKFTLDRSADTACEVRCVQR